MPWTGKTEEDRNGLKLGFLKTVLWRSVADKIIPIVKTC